MSARRFPLQPWAIGGNRLDIPWSIAERAYKTYTRLFGSSQTLERLAERGGFGVREWACLMVGKNPDMVRNTDSDAILGEAIKALVDAELQEYTKGLVDIVTGGRAIEINTAGRIAKELEAIVGNVIRHTLLHTKEVEVCPKCGQRIANHEWEEGLEAVNDPDCLAMAREQAGRCPRCGAEKGGGK